MSDFLYTGGESGPARSYTDYFLQQLSTWDATLPNRFLWLVSFDSIPQTLKNDDILDWEKSSGSFREAISSLTKEQYMKTQGCIFAQGVNIPGEQYATGYADVTSHRGFVPTVYGDGRQAPQEMTIEFRETNTSFVDMLIRPWLILASHYGLVARDPEDEDDAKKNIKTNIHIYQLTKYLPDHNPILRKEFTFFDCVPTRVGNSELTYDRDAMDIRDVTWSYRYYKVEDKVTDVAKAYARMVLAENDLKTAKTEKELKTAPGANRRRDADTVLSKVLDIFFNR
jgi:hypothetical protein